MLPSTNDERCVKPNSTLGMDEACLRIINECNVSTLVYAYPNECYGCNVSEPFANIPANSNRTLIIPTKYDMHMYYTTDHQWCHGSYKFQEGGHYGWNLTEGGCSHYYTLQDPPFYFYQPLLVALAIYMGTFLLYYMVSYNRTTIQMLQMICTGRPRREELENDSSSTSSLDEVQPSVPPMVNHSRSSTRIHSIDTFRGLAILLMIFVNNGGGKYVVFEHSPWFGLTIADLVMPWFAWIMGVTLVVSLRTQLRISISRQRIVLRSLRRTVLLILFGLIINSSHKPTLEDLRFPGILQLLGISYFICATIEAIFMKAQRNFHYGRFMFLQDILDCWPQWLIVIALTTTHTLLTFLLPVTGCKAGYFGPGGNIYYGHYENCTAGAAGYIDRLVFGSHVYNKTNNPIYGTTLRYDPEGLMNTLGAVLLVALGVQAGRILICYYLYLYSKLLRWFSWAAVTGIAAGFLCNWSKDGGVIPVSKNMMTLSFVLTTSSFAFILFAILFYLIDHKRVWSGKPFVYSGANSIFLYIGHYLLMNHFPWTWKIVDPDHVSLLYLHLYTTTLWGVIAYALYKKDIIITI